MLPSSLNRQTDDAPKALGFSWLLLASRLALLRMLVVPCTAGE